MINKLITKLQLKRALFAKILVLFICNYGLIYASEVHVEAPTKLSNSEKISAEDFMLYCKQNPHLVYQDIIIKGKTVFQGINKCDNRYAIIKPILDKFGDRSFSVLDVGAAQGYFSFRIAQDFPKAHCLMIEHKNKNYGHHGIMLHQLCHLNGLPNISYLHQEISVHSLKELSKQSHFDVVLAFLVVHQIDDSMAVRKEVIENLFNLGDIVIIEVSNDVAPELREYVKNVLTQNEAYDSLFLGEVDRYYDPATAYGGRFPNGKGELYLFKKKSERSSA